MANRRDAYEILEIDHAIRDMIMASASDDQIKKCAISNGLKTLKAQGISNLLSGVTTVDELVRVIDMREE